MHRLEVELHDVAKPIRGAIAVGAIAYGHHVARIQTPAGRRSMQTNANTWRWRLEKFGGQNFRWGQWPPGAPSQKCISSDFRIRRCTYRGDVSTDSRTEPRSPMHNETSNASFWLRNFITLGPIPQPPMKLQPNANLGAQLWPIPDALPPRFNSNFFCGNLV
jgi:hypothetical protein